MSVAQQSWRAGFSCQLPQKEGGDEYLKAV